MIVYDRNQCRDRRHCPFSLFVMICLETISLHDLAAPNRLYCVNENRSRPDKKGIRGNQWIFAERVLKGKVGLFLLKHILSGSYNQVSA